MFVCLTGNFPYSTMNCFYVDELLIKLQKDSKYINGVKALIDSDLDLEEWPNEYKRIESMLRFVSGMDNTVKDAVLRLLDLNDRTRLGSHATGGVGALKQHDVFKLNLKIHNHSKPTVCSPPAENNPDSQSEAFCFYDFCWSAIEGKQLMAPPVPVSVELSNSNVFKKFDKFMDSASSDERLWLEQHPSTYLNDFFSSW